MEEFDDGSEKKKYVIIGVIVGLVALAMIVGAVVISRRAAESPDTATSPGGTTVVVNGSAGTNSAAPGGGGQPDAPLSNVVPVPAGGAQESPSQAAGGPAQPAPTTIDPTINRLLTDEEKQDLGYPTSWVVRIQAKRSSVGTVYADYIVESMPSDTDQDMLSDAEEREAGSDPSKADTDGDGLTDWEEVKKERTDPTKVDTDGDGRGDGDELQQKRDPKVRD